MTEIKRLVKSLIEKVLATANIVVTTCSLAIQNGLSSRLSPQYVFKDEDCRSWPQYFCALAGAYSGSVDTFFIAGDPIQKKPYIGSEISKDGVNPFVRELAYTIFQRFEDMGIKVYPFYEQHRMHNESFVKYMSEHHYMDAIVDGTLLRPLPPQAEFMRQFHQETYGVDSNVMVLVTREARAQQIKGGTSLLNDAHAAIAENYIQALEAYLLAAKPSFPATDLSVLYLSTYIAQVANLTQRIQQRGLNAEAKTIGVSQGLQRGVCVRDVLNTKLSAMAGNKRDCLVADTRFQYGYVVIVTGECLDSKTYEFRHPCGYRMFCGSLDHKYSECDAPFKTEVQFVKPKQDNSPDTRPCHHCKEVGHLMADCPYPWCRVCNTVAHGYDDCPKAACKKCGGAHLAKKCT